jgi:hypothetical protein
VYAEFVAQELLVQGGRSLVPAGPHTVGLMFGLSRNRLVGSYVFFKATSRS